MKKMRTLINLAQQEDKAGSRTNYRELFKVLRNAKGAVCLKRLNCLETESALSFFHHEHYHQK